QQCSRSCVILRIARPTVGCGPALSHIGAILAGSDSGVTPEAMSKMTLVRIPDRQCRIDQRHSRLQKLACVLDSNALKIGMRRQADSFRECPCNMKRTA